MNQIQTLFGLISIEDLANTGIAKKSTLYKISAGKYPNDGGCSLLENFPKPVKIGRKVFWRISDVKNYLEGIEQVGFVKPTPITTQCSTGRGRPTRAEVSAARACGLSVRDWRVGNRGNAVVVGGDHGQQ